MKLVSGGMERLTSAIRSADVPAMSREHQKGMKKISDDG
jgi:hypothetical protein